MNTKPYSINILMVTHIDLINSKMSLKYISV